MKLDLKYDDLRAEAQADNTELVKGAVKRHLNALDRMVKIADDPDELVEHIDWSTEHLTSGRKNLRAHQPVAAIANTGVLALSSGESDLIEKIKASFGGDLSRAEEYMFSLSQQVASLQAQNDQLSAELRDEKRAHEATKKTVSVDPKLTQERDDLKADKQRLEKELAQEKAKKAPVTDTDAIALVNKLNGHAEEKTRLRGGAQIEIKIPSKRLTRNEKDLLGLTLVEPASPTTP